MNDPMQMHIMNHCPPQIQESIPDIHVQQDNYNVKQEQEQTVKKEKTKLGQAKDKKREAIDGQAREIIFKVIKFFESEKQNRGYAYPVENVMKRASAATGLSESTIKRIKRDGLKAEATNTKMSGPKKKRIRKTKVQLDYYQLCGLRNIVNDYNERKEVPTLSKILASARHDINYCGGKESLRLILLNKLGIKFKKFEKKEKKPEVVVEKKPQMVPMQQPQTIHHVQMVHQPQIHENNINVNFHQMHPMKMEESCVTVYTNLMPQGIM